MHGSMSAAGGNQASRLARAAPAPPADPTATQDALTLVLLVQRKQVVELLMALRPEC